MELKELPGRDFDQEKYERAKKKVKEIKGFYTHLTVYLIINTVLFLLRMDILQKGFVNIQAPNWSHFITPFFWGIGLAFHGLYVFQHKFKFFKSWEERKIKEYMERDEERIKRTNEWE